MNRLKTAFLALAASWFMAMAPAWHQPRTAPARKAAPAAAQTGCEVLLRDRGPTRLEQTKAHKLRVARLALFCQQQQVPVPAPKPPSFI